MADDKEIRAEYAREDLGEGVRGKYYDEYRNGTNLVLLEPDVAEAFPDTKSVNDALRALKAIAERTASSAKRSTGGGS